MKLTAKELAELLHGTVEGNPLETVSSFAKIEHGKKGQLCFYANPKYEHYVYTCKASIILCNKDFEPKQPIEATLIRLENTYSALADLLNYVKLQKKSYKRHRGLFSLISWSAKIGKKVWIGDFVRIGKKTTIGDMTKIYHNVTIGDNVKIGDKCIIYPGVTIFSNSVIGDRTILHSGCSIGDDGFGNAPQPDGTWKKIEHIGNAVIGSDVEIGPNAVVSNAPMESTIVGNGCRIDSLCYISHGVQVGENTAMAGQSGIAGSAVVGKNCLIGGQVAILGHIKVADRTTVCGKAGVIGNVKTEGQILLGAPAIDRMTYMKAYAKFKASGNE